MSVKKKWSKLLLSVRLQIAYVLSLFSLSLFGLVAGIPLFHTMTYGTSNHLKAVKADDHHIYDEFVVHL